MNCYIALDCFHGIANINHAISCGHGNIAFVRFYFCANFNVACCSVHGNIAGAGSYLSVYSNSASISIKFYIVVSINCIVHRQSGFCRCFYVAFLGGNRFVNRDGCVLTQQRYVILRSHICTDCQVFLSRCAYVTILRGYCRLNVYQSIFTIQIYIAGCLHCALDVNRFFTVADTDIAASRCYRIININFAFITADGDIASRVYLAFCCGCAYADPYTAFSRSQRYRLSGFYIAKDDNRVNTTIGRRRSFIYVNRYIALGGLYGITNLNQTFYCSHGNIAGAGSYLSVYSNSASISIQFYIPISLNCAVYCNSGFCRCFYVAFLGGNCFVNRDGCVPTQQRYVILRSHTCTDCQVFLSRCAYVTILRGYCRLNVYQSIFTIQIYIAGCLHCALDVNRFFTVADTDIAASRCYRIININFAFITADGDIASRVYLAFCCGCAYADPYTAFSRSQRYRLSGFYIAKDDNRVNTTIGRRRSFIYVNRYIALGGLYGITNLNQTFYCSHGNIAGAGSYLSVYSNSASISIQFYIPISLNCAVYCNSGFCRCADIACLGCYRFVNQDGCVLTQQRYIRSGLNCCTRRYRIFRCYFYFTSYRLYCTIQSHAARSCINLYFLVCGCGTAKNNITLDCSYGDRSTFCSCRQYACRIGFNGTICSLDLYILTSNLIVDIDVATCHSVQAYCFFCS